MLFRSFFHLSPTTRYSRSSFCPNSLTRQRQSFTEVINNIYISTVSVFKPIYQSITTYIVIFTKRMGSTQSTDREHESHSLTAASMDGNSVYNNGGYDQPTASTCDSSFCCFFCDGLLTALCGISDSIGSCDCNCAC